MPATATDGFPPSKVMVAQKNLGIPVRYLREFKPLGTGGGLYFFRDVLTRDKPDCLLVLHADICADFKLEDALNFHAAKGEGNHELKERDPAGVHGAALKVRRERETSGLSGPSRQRTVTRRSRPDSSTEPSPSGRVLASARSHWA